MSLRDIRLTVTSAANGAGNATTDVAVFGYLEAVDWIDGSFADGVDAVLSVVNTSSGTEHTLLTLTNADNDAVYYPRRVHDTTAGAAATALYTRFLIAGHLKLAVTNGGDTKTGGCVVYWATE